MEQHIPVKTALWILPIWKNGKKVYLLLALAKEEYAALQNGADLNTLRFNAFEVSGMRSGTKEKYESMFVELHDGVPAVVRASE